MINVFKIRIRNRIIVSELANGICRSRYQPVRHLQSFSCCHQESKKEEYIPYGLENRLKSSRNAINMRSKTRRQKKLKPQVATTVMNERARQVETAVMNQRVPQEYLEIDFFKSPFFELFDDKISSLVKSDLKLLFDTSSGGTHKNETKLDNSTAANRKYHYSTCPQVETMIESRNFLGVVNEIQILHSKKIYLTQEEFISLIEEIQSHTEAVIRISRLYSKSFDHSSFPSSVVETILEAMYKFEMFSEQQELFIQLKDETIQELSSTTVIHSLVSFLITNHIKGALENFKRVCLNPDGGQCDSHIFDQFIRYFHKVTHNTSLTFRCYESWVETYGQTPIETDAYVYSVVRRGYAYKQISFMRDRLKETQRINNLNILFVELEFKLDTLHALRAFYTSKDYYKWVRLIDDDDELLKKFHDLLVKKHLMFFDFEMVRTILIKTTHDMDSLAFRIKEIAHKLAQFGEPDILVQFLAKMKEENGYQAIKFEPYYYIYLWRALVKKYPDQGLEITSKFLKYLKENPNDWSYIANKKLRVKHKSGFKEEYFPAKDITDLYFPTMNYDLYIAEYKVRKGFVLTSRQMLLASKSIRDTNDYRKFKRLVMGYYKKKWTPELEVALATIKYKIFKLKYPGMEYPHQAKLKIQRFLKRMSNKIDSPQVLLSLTRFCIDAQLPRFALKFMEKFMNLKTSNLGDLMIYIYLIFKYGAHLGLPHVIDQAIEEVLKDDRLFITQKFYDSIERLKSSIELKMKNFDNDHHHHNHNHHRDKELPPKYKQATLEELKMINTSLEVFLEKLKLRVYSTKEGCTLRVDQSIDFLDKWIQESRETKIDN